MTYLGNKLVHTVLGLFLGTRENLEYEVKSEIGKAGKCVILNGFIIHICHNDYVKYSIFCLIMTINGVGCRIGCLQCDGGHLEALTSLLDGRNQKTPHSQSRGAESLQTLIQSN